MVPSIVHSALQLIPLTGAVGLGLYYMAKLQLKSMSIGLTSLCERQQLQQSVDDILDSALTTTLGFLEELTPHLSAPPDPSVVHPNPTRKSERSKEEKKAILRALQVHALERLVVSIESVVALYLLSLVATTLTLHSSRSQRRIVFSLPYHYLTRGWELVAIEIRGRVDRVLSRYGVNDRMSESDLKEIGEMLMQSIQQDMTMITREGIILPPEYSQIQTLALSGITREELQPLPSTLGTISELRDVLDSQFFQEVLGNTALDVFAQVWSTSVIQSFNREAAEHALDEAGLATPSRGSRGLGDTTPVDATSATPPGLRLPSVVKIWKKARSSLSRKHSARSMLQTKAGKDLLAVILEAQT